MSDDPTVMRTAGRLLRRFLSWSLLVLLCIEGGLQLSSVLFATDPADRIAPDPDHDIVLCLGDSHTWGLGVGYPAALAPALTAWAPRARVVNLGVPGTNTAQLRTRIAVEMERFHPRLVIVWSGINNNWNRRGTDVWAPAGVPPPPWWQRLLEYSRTVRFVRVWRHQHALQSLLSDGAPLVAPAFYRAPGDTFDVIRRDIGGQEEVHYGEKGEDLSAAELTRVTALDIRDMAEQARAAGVKFMAITYPIPAGPFLAVNAGIVEGAAATGAPVVTGADAYTRLVERYGGKDKTPELYDNTVHPNQLLYDEIGAMVAETIKREGLLAP